MEQDLVNAEISTEDLASIESALVTIKGKLPFLISLSSNEKAQLFKVGENFKTFIQKAINAVNTHPEIMPGTFSVAGFKKDYNLYNSLEPVKGNMASIAKALEDTVTAAGSDSLSASLEVYDEVKNHLEKIPGLKTIYDEMKVCFPRTRKSTKTTPTA